MRIARDHRGHCRRPSSPAAKSRVARRAEATCGPFAPSRAPRPTLQNLPTSAVLSIEGRASRASLDDVLWIEDPTTGTIDQVRPSRRYCGRTLTYQRSGHRFEIGVWSRWRVAAFPGPAAGSASCHGVATALEPRVREGWTWPIRTTSETPSSGQRTRSRRLAWPWVKRDMPCVGTGSARRRPAGDSSDHRGRSRRRPRQGHG